MEIKILCVGTLKESYLKSMASDYLKRLANYVKISVEEVKEDDTIVKEGERLLAKVNKDDYLILLDLDGRQLDSLEFANVLDKHMTYSSSRLLFVIGGSLGVSEPLRQRANYRLCLSKMTFTHQFARVIILEQIYRGYKILNNQTYHK